MPSNSTAPAVAVVRLVPAVRLIGATVAVPAPKVALRRPFTLVPESVTTALEAITVPGVTPEIVFNSVDVAVVAVEVPVEKNVEWEALTASAVAADVGNAVDLTDSVTVNRGGTTHHVVTITGIISATKVNVVINALYDSYVGA